ncbi:transposase [Ochrobactrum quorumnocens]|uniref:transposase n=1 Tax=Ochrobactrum quorumnocens TaxID=271865 RepID=UPI003854978C
MAWTETARRDYGRRGLRYASDCTDDEWSVVAPLLQPMSKVGRPREHDPRKLWNAIQYMATTGCQWAQLPKEFPPFTTVQYLRVPQSLEMVTDSHSRIDSFGSFEPLQCQQLLSLHCEKP